MKAKLFITTLLALVLAMGFQSCRKDNKPDEPKPTMDDLKIPDGFTFESTRVEDITIKMPPTVSFDVNKSRFNIYTLDPAEGGKLITAGSFNTDGEWTGEIRVPTALDSVYVQTIAGSLYVTLPKQNTKEGGVIIDFGDDYGNTPPDTAVSGNLKTANYAFGGNNIEGVKADFYSTPNVIVNGDFEDDDFGYIYGWYSPHPAGKWYFTSYSNQVMSRITESGSNHVIATPTNSTCTFYGGASQMISASPGDLITFSADIKIVGHKFVKDNVWLYLIPYDAQGNTLDYYWVNAKLKKHWKRTTICATMPSGTAEVQVLFWIWDYLSASIYIDNVVVTGPVTDSDGDGVDDDLDDYPNDPTRAFNVYYPNSTDWGTFAYEDLWPGKGDYDFNDLILDYHFKSVLNSSNELVEFFTDYSVRAVGASLENGFGFMLGGDPSNVASVSGTNLTENYINLNANGTEQDQTNTVVILFDNAFENIGSSGASFINTKPDIDYVDPDTNQLHVVYSTPVSVSTTGTAPYNPFLIVNKERGKEVHLAGQEPTDLVDAAYFGQWFDDSDPATGKYYQSATNLPWAIDLPVSFDYPVEQVQIINAYTHFQQWAETGGAAYPDWYEDLSGYRVSENIYSPPSSGSK